MTAVTHNEIIKILKNYGINNAVTLSEEDAKNELINLYRENFPDDYDAVADDDIDDIAETAFEALSEEDYDSDADSDEDTEDYDDEDDDYDDAENYDEKTENYDNNTNYDEDIEDISVDPMKKSEKNISSNPDKSASQTDNNQPEKIKSTSLAAGSDKKTKGDRTIDITADVASTLPTRATKIIDDKIRAKWSEIVAKSNNSRIAAFTIDTPVKDYLEGKSFVVDDKAAQSFIDKWDDKTVEGKLVRKVVDDNEYDESGKIIKQGENMKNFMKIKEILRGNKTFKVRVPLQREQKVNGIIICTLDGKEEERIFKLDEIPEILVSEYGARIPGDPGIIVNGVGHSEKETKTSAGQIKKSVKTILLISYKGKGDALNAPDGRFIKQTAEAVPEEEAMKLYNKKENDFTAKSELSVKVNATQETTDDDGNKVLKKVVRTVRLSGKVKVPFFKRKQEYNMLGEVKHKGVVTNLTVEDVDRVVEITAAISKTSSAIAAKFEIQNILNDVSKVKTDAVADNL